MSSTPTSAAEWGEAVRPGAEQIRCWQCGANQVPDLFCPVCQAIQPIPEQADYFEVLGLPRRLLIDTAALRQRYYDLHRRLHPDLYQTGPQAARVASLRNTATVNRAYQTLRDPVDRGLYWMALHGESIGRQNNRVPANLAALVFDLQEKLEELRLTRSTNGGAAALAAEIAEERAELQNRQTALMAELEQNFARWDADASDPVALTTELKTILSALAYLGTLIRDVDKELES